jgi:hypothetical protein
VGPRLGARGEIHTDGFELGVAHDVPSRLWELMLLDPEGPVPSRSVTGEHPRAAGPGRRPRVPGGADSQRVRPVDVSACLRAAFLELSVVTRLASPADVVCRNLLALARAAA